MYVRHTTIGDPVADAVVEELATVASPSQVHRLIAATLDNWDSLPADTPGPLSDLVDATREVPDWYDRDLAMEATLAFLRVSDLVLGGLIAGAIVEGFSTLISKSFRIRSRITENGVRRLKQNMLQLVEQFMPGGMDPGGDGWKLSLRIRLVHAQARLLLRQSEEWDAREHGEPLSAAHMLLGAASFSGRLMQHVARLGGGFSKREREGYVHVWRRTGQVMGIPEEILFRDFESSVRTFRIAALCEPPPDDDAIIMANSIVNSAPLVLGVTGTKERRAYAAFVYKVSRELIGDELADALRFPPGTFKRELPLLRLRNLGERLLRGMVPHYGKRRSIARFEDLMEAANLGTYTHSYRLPGRLYDEESHEW